MEVFVSMPDFPAETFVASTCIISRDLAWKLWSFGEYLSKHMERCLTKPVEN